MAGLLLPLFLDLMGGVPQEPYIPPGLTSTSQDSSADSNVFHSQGPATNHGSINFNLHLHQVNRSVSSAKGPDLSGESPTKLTRQNEFLKDILSQIAPSIIPSERRKKRLARRVPLQFARRNNTRRLCFRPSPSCPPRSLPTTKSPIRTLPPLHVLRAVMEPAGKIAERLSRFYLQLLMKDGVNPVPRQFQMALSKFYGLKIITSSADQDRLNTNCKQFDFDYFKFGFHINCRKLSHSLLLLFNRC